MEPTQLRIKKYLSYTKMVNKDKYPELVKHTYKENNTKSAVLKGQELFTRIIIQRKGGLKPRARILNQF